MKTGKRSKLKKLLSSDEILYGPAVYDCIGAMVAEEVGFPLIFTGGFGIAASLYGLPDLGYLTLNDMLSRAGAIASAVNIPVIADMDTGYGGPLNLIRLVEDAIRHDIGGIILEDQKWPKRCGHLRGKQLVETSEYLEKLSAADRTRNGEDFTIVARTDALSVCGLDEALRRGEAYLLNGADLLFIESPRSVDEIKKIAHHFQGKNLMINIIEGGITPVLPVQELAEMGYKLVAYALTGLLSATDALMKGFKELYSNGLPPAGSLTFSDINRLLKTENHIKLSERFSASSREDEHKQ